MADGGIRRQPREACDPNLPRAAAREPSERKAESAQSSTERMTEHHECS